MRLNSHIILTLAILVGISPLSSVHGLEVPQNAGTIVPNSGIYSQTSATGDSAARWMFDAALNLVTVAAVPASAIRFVPLVMGVIQSVPEIKSGTDSAKNSVIEGVSGIITPTINRAIGFVPVPADALRIIETVNEDVTSGKSRADTGIFGDYRRPIPQEQGSLQPVDPSDNAILFPYTYRYEQQGPVEQSGEQDNNAGILLRPSAGIQQVSASQETSWGSWNFRNSDSAYSDTVAPAVEPQVEQPAVTPWTSFPALSGNSSNQSMFSGLSADDYGPYDWASQFYSLPFDSGQIRQSDEWPGFDADGSSYDWSL